MMMIVIVRTSTLFVVMMVVLVRTMITCTGTASTIVISMRSENARDVTQVNGAATTAVAYCDKTNNVAQKTEACSNEHDISVKIVSLTLGQGLTSLNCLINEPSDKYPNDQDADKGAKDLGPMVSIRPFLVGLPLGYTDGEDRDHEGQDIREEVSGVGHDGNGVGEPSSDKLDDHEGKHDKGEDDQLP